MVRHEYTYFILISPVPGTVQAPDSLMDALGKSEISSLPEGPIMFTLGGDNVITGGVNPDIGTIEQTGKVEAEIMRLSRKFPDYLFELSENDEEDHSVAFRTVFLAGKPVQQQSACTLSPQEAINTAGRGFVAEALKAAGYTEAAAFVGTMPMEWPPYGQEPQGTAASPDEGRMAAILAKPLDFTMLDERPLAETLLENGHKDVKTIGGLYSLLNTFDDEGRRLPLSIMYGLHRFLIESVLKELADAVGDAGWESTPV